MSIYYLDPTYPIMLSAIRSPGVRYRRIEAVRYERRAVRAIGRLRASGRILNHPLRYESVVHERMPSSGTIKRFE